MYFSGVDSKDITFDDPVKRCIRVNRELYTRVEDDYEKLARVFLDTRLIRIYDDDDLKQENNSVKSIQRNEASVTVEIIAFTPVLFYVSGALITADFREMSSDEFKDRSLSPLDKTLRRSKLKLNHLTKEYSYPFGSTTDIEFDIQRYFKTRICGII